MRHATLPSSVQSGYPSSIRGKHEGDMTIENPASVWRLRVELLDVTPTVWRRFDTYAEVKLSQLHYFIQGAMGWELMHLFLYQDGRGHGSQISSELLLCDVCRVDDALTYTYDFGDNWRHLVTVEKDDGKADGHLPARGCWQVCLPAGRLWRAVGLWGHAQGTRWPP